MNRRFWPLGLLARGQSALSDPEAPNPARPGKVFLRLRAERKEILAAGRKIDIVIGHEWWKVAGESVGTTPPCPWFTTALRW